MIVEEGMNQLYHSCRIVAPVLKNDELGNLMLFHNWEDDRRIRARQHYQKENMRVCYEKLFIRSMKILGDARYMSTCKIALDRRTD